MTTQQTTRNLPTRALLVASLVFGGGACESKRNANGSDVSPRVVSATDPAVEPGKEAITPHFAMSIKGSRPCTVEAHLTPPEGVVKFAVEVEIRALGEAEVPANPFYATLTTADGGQFESTLAGCRPLLTAQRLNANQSARGWVTFDIPEAAKPVSLVYRPVIIGTGSEKVELLLGN